MTLYINNAISDANLKKYKLMVISSTARIPSFVTKLYVVVDLNDVGNDIKILLFFRYIALSQCYN